MDPRAHGSGSRIAALLVLAAALACGSDVQRARDHVDRGLVHLHEGRKVEAALEFKSALRVDPTNIDALNRLAEIEIVNGNLRLALTRAQEAHRLDPTNAESALRLASLIRAEQPDRAEALVEAIIEQEPEKAAGYIGRSEHALELGRMRDAVTASRRAMNVAPDDPLAYWHHGRVMQALIRKGQLTDKPAEDTTYSSALAAFERYIEKGGPKPWMAQLEEARVMSSWEGRVREAGVQFRNALDHALEAGPVDDQRLIASAAAAFARNARNDELREYALERLVEIDPRDHRAWSSLADLHKRKRRDPEAVWQRFLGAFPDDPRPHVEYARHLVFAWKLEEALTYLSRKAEEGIDPPMLLGAMASTQLAAGRLKDATETVKRLEREFPGHPRTILERAQLDMRRGQVAKARRSLRALVEEHPGYHAQLLLARAEEVSANGDAAIAALDEAISSTPFFGYEARRMRARLLADRDDCHGSIQNLQLIQERMPLTPKDQVLLAECHYRTGRPELGRVVLRDTLEERNPPAEAIIAFASREGDSDPESAGLARRYLGRLLRRQPRNWDAVAELTRLDAAAGRYPEALTRLDGLVATDPDRVPPPIRLLRARVSADAGREAGTLEDARAAFEGQPKLAGALELLVALQLRKGQIDEAVAAAEEAARVGALEGERRVLLAQLYRMKGRDGEALDLFEQAIQSAPKNATLYYHKGLALRSLDRNEEASKAFEKALTISPDFPEAADARRALEGT